MTDARDDILARIRQANARALDGRAEEPKPRVRSIAALTAAGHVVELFAARLRDYGVTVHRMTQAELPALIGRRAADLGLAQLAIAPGIAIAAPSGVDIITARSSEDRDAVLNADGAVTGCAFAIAETGTLVLDGSGCSGPRLLSLLPDWHLCLVRAEQILPDVPDTIAALQPAASEGRPVTFISGPSATADIEFKRVEGVHGPRRLEVAISF